ncbi:uncharacterized protein C8Q71DRAFT_754959 [Rhodofomes roseus]|uniref:Uncharacterized protein n=1 Tax=Rhodofomes roseus TaxID=34475 RepID=A0ABQ8KJW3_9APHY|nr:uncharacterized protein C8Q71DRAFT_754959 [Rhodofomes roseus]KAH9837877.1 hypothetical protein C8Q71DRAFT_754959 [Rhodofomes roseus]
MNMRDTGDLTQPPRLYYPVASAHKPRAPRPPAALPTLRAAAACSAALCSPHLAAGPASGSLAGCAHTAHLSSPPLLLCSPHRLPRSPPRPPPVRIHARLAAGGCATRSATAPLSLRSLRLALVQHTPVPCGWHHAVRHDPRQLPQHCLVP